MEILDRYLHEIGKRLPSKQRDDIIKELNTLLLDSIDEARESSDGSKTDEEIAAEIIKNFGNPKEIAARYSSNNYIIGPRFYETYVMVLKIVVTVLAALAGASLLIGSLFTDFSTRELIKQMIQFVPSLFSVIISAVGIVTIIFAIIERTVDDTKLALTEKDFDPYKLPKVPTDKEKIKYSDVITDLIGSFFMLALLNSFPDKLNIFIKSGNGYNEIPIFSPAAFNTYLPYWNVILIASIIISVIILKNGKNTRITAILGIILSLLVAVALSVMMYDKNLFGFTEASFPESIKPLYLLILLPIKVSIAITITVLLGSSGFKAYKLFRK